MASASTVRFRLAVAGVSIAVGLGVVIASPVSASTEQAKAAVTPNAISCSTAASSGDGPFYAGPDASTAYDARFSNSFALPDESTHTPQGVASWTNWDGKGNDIFLVVSYHTGENARIYGISTATNALVGAVEIADTHAGGIAVVGDWIYVENDSTSIRKYRVADIRAALPHKGGYLYVKSVGTPRNVYGASFLTGYGSYIFSGKFNETAHDKMYAYKVNSDGSLTTQAGGYEVPTKTQGVAVTSTRFIFSTSYGRTNRGNIYVVKRGYTSLDSAALACFRSPSMNEGMAIYGAYVYVLFESGSYEYPGALNPITHAHKGVLSKLVNMVS